MALMSSIGYVSSPGRWCRRRVLRESIRCKRFALNEWPELLRRGSRTGVLGEPFTLSNDDFKAKWISKQMAVRAIYTANCAQFPVDPLAGSNLRFRLRVDLYIGILLSWQTG